jgi:hypothetical protein
MKERFFWVLLREWCRSFAPESTMCYFEKTFAEDQCPNRRHGREAPDVSLSILCHSVTTTEHNQGRIGRMVGLTRTHSRADLPILSESSDEESSCAVPHVVLLFFPTHIRRLGLYGSSTSASPEVIVVSGPVNRLPIRAC